MSELFETIMCIGGMYIEVSGYCAGENKERYVEDVTSVRVLTYNKEKGCCSSYSPVMFKADEFKKDFEDQINESLLQDDLNRDAVHDDLAFDAWRDEQALKNMEEK